MQRLFNTRVVLCNSSLKATKSSACVIGTTVTIIGTRTHSQEFWWNKCSQRAILVHMAPDSIWWGIVAKTTSDERLADSGLIRLDLIASVYYIQVLPFWVSFLLTHYSPPLSTYGADWWNLEEGYFPIFWKTVCITCSWSYRKRIRVGGKEDHSSS